LSAAIFRRKRRITSKERMITGRKSNVSIQDKRAVARMLKQGMALRKAAAQVGVSKSTAHKIARTQGVKFISYKKRTALTDKHKKLRFEYENAECDREDWRTNVVFTDEKLFTLDKLIRGGEWVSIQDPRPCIEI
jgi:hypothetical protein